MKKADLYPRTVTVRLTETQHAKLTAAAVADERPTAAYLRELIVKHNRAADKRRRRRQ